MSELPWWEDRHVRLFQPNLREVDADLDVDVLFDRLQAFDANTILLNTGGVCAFYPTDLAHHPRAAPLVDRPDGDLTGTAIERAHADDIRFVARFDFSKVQTSVFDANPEWAYRDPDGQPVHYHGVVHACINGGYQQAYAFDILEEALTTYPIDGVFFNMFGYIEWDYDGTYHGPCHCSNCQERFHAYTDGETELPPRHYDDVEHPVYHRFKRETATEQLDRVRSLIDGLDRDIAVATYSQRGTHVVTSESNTGVDRSPPRWPYSAVDNVAAVEDSWGKPNWNIAINAVDLPYRFQGVSAQEIRTRLYGALLRGGPLAFCVNGSIAAYPDRSNFSAVEEVYGIAAKLADTYQSLAPSAQIALVNPDGARPEYRGWFRALTEAHVPFHVRTEASLGHPAATPLADYDVIVLPGPRLDADPAVTALTTAHRSGTTLLATGARFATDAPAFLADTFDAYRETIQTDDAVRGAYVDATDFPGLPETDLVVVDEAFAVCETSTATGLPFVTPGTFGPPERVGREGLDRTTSPGLIDIDRAVYLPWNPGTLYHHHGFEAHAGILHEVLDAARSEPPLLETTAPPTVEIALGTVGDGRFVQLLNRAGCTGVSYHEPPRATDVSVTLPGVIEEAHLLVGEGDVTREVDGDETTITLSTLDTYAAIDIESD